MILTIHLVFGALIAKKIKNLLEVFLLAFFTHYVLDFIPHSEYSIKHMLDRGIKKFVKDFSKIFLDLFVGFLLIFWFFPREINILFGALSAILPDFLTVLNSFFKNRFLNTQNFFHTKIIHYFKYKKVPLFLRILSQVIVLVAVLRFL